MYLYIGSIVFILSFTMIFVLESDVYFKTFKNSIIILISALILAFLGAGLCLYDYILRHRDYAYFLKHEYDRNKYSHYICHKKFLTSNHETSFNGFGMIHCIEEQDKLQKEEEKKFKEKATAEKEKLLVEQEKVKMNFQQK